MPRPLIVVGSALLLALLLLFALDLVPSTWQPGAAEPDPDAPLAFETLDAVPGDAAKTPPTLAPAGRGPPDVGEAPAAPPAPPPPAGPYGIRVIDALTRAPLAEVALHDAEGRELGHTDEEGTWEAPARTATSLRFRARRAGYVLHEGTALPDRPVTVRLHLGIDLDVQVLREPGSRTLAGASVRVWDLDLGREVLASTTDEQGRFRMEGVRPHHPLRLIVNAPGLVPHLERLLLTEVPPELLEVRIPEGNRIEGHVRDATGAAKEGVTVWLMPSERRPFDERIAKGDATERRRIGARDLQAARTGVAVTDEHGRYAFDGVPALASVQVAAFRASRHVVRSEAVRFPGQGETRTVDLELGATGALRIAVVDAILKPVAHADILLEGPEGTVVPRSTDPRTDGVLHLDGIQPGGWRIRAMLPGRPPEVATVTVAAGPPTRVQLRFAAGGELLGVVGDAGGRPIWKARVEWQAQDTLEYVEVRTDERGRFRMQGLRGTRGLLTVTARDLPHTRTTYERFRRAGVRPGEGRQHITLPDATGVTGRFPDLEPGTAVFCRMVVGEEVFPWSLVLDERRAFRRDGPEPDIGGVYFVFERPERAPLIVHERDGFHSGEVRDLGTLRFEQTNPRMGRVLDGEGRPLHGAKVTIDEAWSGRSTRTDRLGRFVFAGLPDRRVIAVVEAERHRPLRAWFGTDSQFHAQVFQLQPGRGVVVVVTDRTGRPVRFATVAAMRHPDGADVDAPPPQPVVRVTDGSGRATLPLPEGSYQLVALVEEPGGPGTPRAGKDITVTRSREGVPMTVHLTLSVEPR